MACPADRPHRGEPRRACGARAGRAGIGRGGGLRVADLGRRLPAVPDGRDAVPASRDRPGLCECRAQPGLLASLAPALASGLPVRDDRNPEPRVWRARGPRVHADARPAEARRQIRAARGREGRRAAPEKIKPPAEIVASGITWAAPIGPGRVLEKVSTEALGRRWEDDDAGLGYHVGPGGSGGSARPGSYREALERLKSGKPVWAPKVVIGSDGKISIEDGRDRIAAARDLGLEEIVISVPKKDRARILKAIRRDQPEA